MGIMYEKKKAATFTDMMALKAAVLPMLIRASRSEIVVLTRIAYNGRAVLVWTYDATSDITETAVNSRCIYPVDVVAERNTVVSSKRP